MLWGFKKRNDGCSRKHMGQMGEEEATERVTENQAWGSGDAANSWQRRRGMRGCKDG